MSGMNRDVCLVLTGATIGAAVMYMLDPDRGGRRRALARDKLVAAGNKTSMYAGKVSRDLGNRAQGLVAETRSLFRHEPVTDDVLVERVKSELGRHAVHHRGLDITASGGRVTLRGPALADEVDKLVSAVTSLRGVTGVDNQLEVHERDDGIPSLQGEVAVPALA